MSENEEPILYVLVVGFHHKKGCQVEYSYPELYPGHPNECPPGWKYLPTLALPDGSHNYDTDTVFFHLPSLTSPKQTVYGISCFRQIPVEKIKNKTSDITRGTVQKSVCVLSRVPLYGQIQVKMHLITHAYFEKGDFSKVSILEETFHHLNAVMKQYDMRQHSFVGLSAKEFILQWKNKALQLFKLLLLEKRVMFFKSPVHPLCSTILTLVSLFPEMIENGLDQSACIRLSRPMSPMPEYSDEELSPVVDNKVFSNGTDKITTKDDKNVANEAQKNGMVERNCILEGKENDSDVDNTEYALEVTDSLDNQIKEDSPISATSNIGEKSSSLRRELSSDTISDVVQNNMSYLANLSTESCGFPLSIYTKGSLCLPYLSLPYMDLLSDVNVRSYIVGTTNFLFKQKRQLYDVLVDIDSGRIECPDINLRKYLHLTTEDLRFAEYLVKHASEESQDDFLDGVGWEGSEEWIRTQFRVYLLCLLRTSMIQDGARELDHFNSSFITAWRETHNYKMWLSGINPGILEVHPGHPFAGQLSYADMKLRLAHTMQNTESGRKLNQAMATTGKAVANTGKAVGGAISQAKGAFSSWWNNFMVPPDQRTAEQTTEPTNKDSLETKSNISETKSNCSESKSSGSETKSNFSENKSSSSETKPNCSESSLNGSETESGGSETKPNCSENKLNDSEAKSNCSETKSNCSESRLNGSESNSAGIPKSIHNDKENETYRREPVEKCNNGVILSSDGEKKDTFGESEGHQPGEVHTV